MAQLTGLQIALRNQISRQMNDTAKNASVFVGMLAALDNLFQVQSRFQRSDDVSGEKIQVDFRTGLPTVSGVKAVTGSADSLRMPVQIGSTFEAGTMPWSHYQFREDIRTAYIQHLDTNPKSVVPYIKKVSDACKDAVMLKLSQDVLPDSTLAPALTTGITGDVLEDKILSLYYPLLVGRDGNDPTAITPTTFKYLDFDFNTRTAFRAVNAGTSGAAFGNMTLSNLRKKILMPMRNRGSKPDLIVTDSDIYDYCLSTAESKVVIEQMDRMEFGGTWVKYGGLFWMTDPQEDAKIAASGSNFHQAAVLQTSDWHFIFNGMLKDFSVIDNPETAALKTVLGYMSVALVCEAPRMQGHCFNVTP